MDITLRKKIILKANLDFEEEISSKNVLFPIVINNSSFFIIIFRRTLCITLRDRI